MHEQSQGSQVSLHSQTQVFSWNSDGEVLLLHTARFGEVGRAKIQNKRWFEYLLTISSLCILDSYAWKSSTVCQGFVLLVAVVAWFFIF